MSADNWTICPQCKAGWEAEQQERMRNVTQSYGKVPADEYLALLKSAEELNQIEIQPTLREDYQLGIEEDFTFSVTYRASCTGCPFEFEYKYEVEAPRVARRRGR